MQNIKSPKTEVLEYLFAPMRILEVSSLQKLRACGESGNALEVYLKFLDQIRSRLEPEI
jgi:hypothetical protein